MLNKDFAFSVINSCNPGWLGLALSVAVRAKNETNTKALISQIAHHPELKDDERERILELVLQFFSTSDREWFDKFRDSIDWEQ